MGSAAKLEIPEFREKYLTDGVELFYVLGSNQQGLIVEETYTEKTMEISYEDFLKMDLRVVVPEER